MDARDDLAEIDERGSVHPVAGRAAMRLMARRGLYRVLPAPSPIVMMRQVASEGHDARPCGLAGEITAGGRLCDVASFIGHSSWRGELVVLDDDDSRSIYFDHGQVVGAQSSAERERLGQVLFRYGVLTESQAHAVAEEAQRAGQRFGEAAVRLGLVTRERLFSLMARQIEETFYGMLLVSRGTFCFFDGFDEAVLSARQALSVGSLIRDGVRRMHETRYFRARIPSDRHIPARAPGRAAPEVDPLGVYAQVDDQRSLAELCRGLGAGEFEVTRAVFQLVQSGHLVVRPPHLSPVEAVGIYNRAISIVLRELDAMDQGDEVRSQLEAYAAASIVHTSYLAGAGPSDDGTFEADQVAARIALAPARRAAEEQLARWLFEHASYALFLARPHVRRAEDARAQAADGPRLSERVTQILRPIAPETDTLPGGTMGSR